MSLVGDGLDAKRVLDDQAFKDAVAAADAEIVHQWRSADTIEDRERAWARQSALQEVQQQLKIVMGRGEVAALEWD